MFLRDVVLSDYIGGDWIMTANSEMMYWHTNPDWFTLDYEKGYELTPSATQRAIESFALYKALNSKKDNKGKK